MRKRGGGPRQPSQPGALSREDAELWRHAARSLEPLRKAKKRVRAAAPEPAAFRDRNEQPSPRAGSGKNPAPVKPYRPAPPTSPPPQLAEFDRRTVRRIAAGRSEIEARIDLHGLRQREAHSRLRAFILDAYSRGLRSLLVITGKGTRPASRETPSEIGPSDRGVIRRGVPFWLEEPDLRAVVVGFTPAHARHGGEGALYVQLRKRRPR